MRLRLSPILCFLASALLAAVCAAETNGPQTDQAVLRAALEHFAERADTSSMNENGVLLIAARSIKASAWLANSVTTVQYENANCKDLSGFRESFLERNKRSSRVTAAVKASKRLRIVSGEDSDSLPVGVSARDVKTALTLSFPAYSADQTTALVYFQFLWSIHSADAIYVLRREGGGWVVSCSDLIFHV